MSVSVEIKRVTAGYGAKTVLENVDLSIPGNSIYALIGPSGCGKTTLLRSINRLNDLIAGFTLSGEILVGNDSIYNLKRPKDIRRLRMNAGMIFQRPNPLPMSVMRNMVFPYMEHMACSLSDAKELAVEKLRAVGLYDEVKDRLYEPANMLSGGQQQRLCIARALMLPSQLMLMDEPCSALDPISTFKIEDILGEIKKSHTVVMVTHNMEQARRISDFTAFFHSGRVIESGETLRLFLRPEQELTRRYVAGY